LGAFLTPEKVQAFLFEILMSRKAMDDTRPLCREAMRGNVCKRICEKENWYGLKRMDIGVMSLQEIQDNDFAPMNFGNG